MKNTYDLIITGAGPSALTAAIYAAREDIKTLLIEKGVVGGLMATIDNIENYPGFPNGIEGLSLTEEFQKQAERFGAEIKMFTTVNEVKKVGNLIKVTTDDGIFESKTALIASGNSYRKLNIPGEDQAHYCATCDGAFYRDKRLVVIGGANAAVQEAMFLTKFATHIDLIVRSHIKASEVLQKELAKFVTDKKIDVYEHTTPDEIIQKDGHVVAVAAHNTDHPDKKMKFDCDGTFVFAGVIPNTNFLADSDIKLDKSGHIITNHELMTNIEGIFASGDVRSGATKQVVSATGEGATAALSIRECLNKI